MLELAHYVGLDEKIQLCPVGGLGGAQSFNGHSRFRARQVRSEQAEADVAEFAYFACVSADFRVNKWPR